LERPAVVRRRGGTDPARRLRPAGAEGRQRANAARVLNVPLDTEAIESDGGPPVTGHGHRIVNFTLVGAVTCSLPAALCALLGAAFPDSSEWLLWGRNRNRWHRRLTHWFVPWLALSLLCLDRAGWRTPTLAGLAEGSAGDLWACAGFWLLGGLLHIALDACCGKVPLLLPWRRTFGAHLFRTSPRPGELSPGEMAVTFFLSATALGAWAARAGLL